MVMGGVDDLAWSQLRMRRNVPSCVVDGIPPEDLQSFVRLVATNPLLFFPDATVVRTKIASLRNWRAELANPHTVTLETAAVRTSVKRSSIDVDRARKTSLSNGGGKDNESDGEQPKRKHRRSARPALNSSADVGNEMPEASVTEAPKIGDDYQAIVPVGIYRPEYWQQNPIQVESKLVFSEEICGGRENVSAFIDDVNKAFRRRDGFPLAPFQLECALQELAASNGDQIEAKRKVMEKVRHVPYFPGIKGTFKYEEQCLFVRSLTEHSKNFSYMSKHILTTRSTAELVWLYYSRYKQLYLQRGTLKGSEVNDASAERIRRVPLTAERVVGAVACLGITAGDGFPLDSRVSNAVLSYRNTRVERVYPREHEVGRRVTRTRSTRHGS